MHKPIKVAMLQCCTVGVKLTLQQYRFSISHKRRCHVTEQVMLYSRSPSLAPGLG